MLLTPILSVLLVRGASALPGSAACDNCGNADLKDACKPITFVFARGTGEPGGPLGIVVAPGVVFGLKHRYGLKNVAAVGVKYPAKLDGNYEPEGCSSDGIDQFTSDLKDAATKCPRTKIVAAGFSQGAACLHAAMKRLDKTTIDRIVAAVTFGDPRNKQDGGRIPNYPEARTKIFCAEADPICQGVLKTTGVHRSYYKDIGPAVKFLNGQIGDIKDVEKGKDATKKGEQGGEEGRKQGKDMTKNKGH